MGSRKTRRVTTMERPPSCPAFDKLGTFQTLSGHRSPQLLILINTDLSSRMTFKFILLHCRRIRCRRSIISPGNTISSILQETPQNVPRPLNKSVTRWRKTKMEAALDQLKEFSATTDDAGRQKLRTLLRKLSDSTESVVTTIDRLGHRVRGR